MKSIVFTLVLSLLVIGMSGCATQPPQPSALSTEADSAGGVKILSVRLQQEGSGLLVHGTVERKVGYDGTRFRHLDLEVFGPDGKVLAKQATNFDQNPIPYSRVGAGRTSYSFRLINLPPPQSTIRVTVDCSELAACELIHQGR